MHSREFEVSGKLAGASRSKSTYGTITVDGQKATIRFVAKGIPADKPPRSSAMVGLTRDDLATLKRMCDVAISWLDAPVKEAA